MTASRITELRQPKQERSRRTFERVQEATLALLKERGPDAFTLADVCARADASMGAIYGRVNGKDDLIRLLHEQEMNRIDRATQDALESVELDRGLLDQAVLELITRVATVLRDNADIFRPFMLRAVVDQQISSRGRTSHRLMSDHFAQVLLRHTNEIKHADARAAAEWCFIVVYSVLGRRLGLGSTLEGSDDRGNWDELISQLTVTVTAYLRLPAA